MSDSSFKHAGFVDRAQIHAKAGDGGAGAVSFRKEAHKPKAGPDGGNGGRGGDVILVASRSVHSFSGFLLQPFRRAENGLHGSSKLKHGKSGKNKLVEVPLGTVVRTLEGDVVAELLHEGQQLVIAEGGRGGLGNARFLTNATRAPDFAEQGEAGEDKWFNLELKTISDIGLVGLPNSGKSTLLSKLTRAKPKIANYEFTTLTPNLGALQVREFDTNAIIADIPGIIEGASRGLGLGFEFLKHIERSRALIFVLNGDPETEINPVKQLQILHHELMNYSTTLAELPKLVVLNKVDLLDADQRREYLKNPDIDVLVSSVTGENLEKLIALAHELLSNLESLKTLEKSYRKYDLDKNAVSVRKISESKFEISGRAATRAIAFSNLNNPTVRKIVNKRLSALKIDQLLKKHGADPGCEVRIGELVFRWDPELNEE